MKKLIVMFAIMSLLIAANSWAVIVTGSGMTKEEAINNGLREAVEMFTGSFVYGVTDVENYTFKKDQVVASSLGYVKSYRIIKSSKIDELIVLTLDVTLSEDKIESIIRENVKLVTVEDVLKDYNNVTQRQDQIRKLADMLKIMAGRPVYEKYTATYEGYEIKRIGARQVDIILKVRVSENPFYSKTYNEILKNLSEPTDSSDVWILGGKYRIQAGRLINTKYNIPRDAKTPNTVDCVKAQIHVNDTPVDKCREYRDNLLVVYSPTEFFKAVYHAFPAAFKQAWNEEDIVIDDKWDNVAIKKSKIVPPEGFPLKVKYTIENSADIKGLKDLKLTMGDCPMKTNWR